MIDIGNATGECIFGERMKISDPKEIIVAK